MTTLVVGGGVIGTALAHDLQRRGHSVTLIERAGMKGERIIRDLSRIPDNPHYFSTMIIRRNGGFQAHWVHKELEAETLLAEVSVV